MPLPRNKVSSSPLFNYWLNLFSFMVSLLLMVIKWTSTWTRKCRFNSDNVVYMPIANGWFLTARVTKSPKMYWISRSCTFFLKRSKLPPLFITFTSTKGLFLLDSWISNKILLQYSFHFGFIALSISATKRRKTKNMFSWFSPWMYYITFM